MSSKSQASFSLVPKEILGYNHRGRATGDVPSVSLLSRQAFVENSTRAGHPFKIQEETTALTVKDMDWPRLSARRVGGCS